MQLTVELPEGMTVTSLRELLAMHDVRSSACRDLASECHCQLNPASVGVTEAERSVLRAFSYCNTNEEIAAALHVSVETVRTHVKSLYRKLRVRSRGFAVGRALRLGLLGPTELLPPSNG